MIYDKLDNIKLYQGLSDDIYIGLSFLKQVEPGIEPGVYQINSRVKAIVSEYETKMENEYSYEAHKKNIDIQYTLKGKERVACLPIERMREEKSYSKKKDAAFYSATESPQELTIGDGYFAVFYPQDGHKPQLYIEEPTMVKKIVVKIQINN